MARQRPFPLDRAEFINVFLNDLDRPYKSFLAAQIADVVGQNEAITGAPCYMIGDTVYARGPTIAKIGKYNLGGIAQLQPHLQVLHDEFMEHYREHAENWLRFSQTLRTLIMRTANWQDLRDMFPDRVLQPYLHRPGFEGLTRTCPDLQTAFLQQSQEPWEPDLIQKYHEISDQLDLYVGYRLL